MNRERIKLRFWQGAGPVLTGIAGVFDRWWDKVRGWIDFCLAPADARTAPMPLVNLLAWERGITRLFGEPESLYRLRVYYAFLNAKDAGQKAGFERIFQRLGIELNGQAERVDNDNWDVIFLESNDDLFTSVPGLFGALTESYGRTCRRYALIQSVVFCLRHDCRTGRVQHRVSGSGTGTSRSGVRLFHRCGSDRRLH